MAFIFVLRGETYEEYIEIVMKVGLDQKLLYFGSSIHA